MNNPLKIRKEKKYNSGFTLMETILATTLITTIAIGILPIFINAISVNAEVKRKQIALTIAENKIEEYRAKTYSEIIAAQPNPETNSAENFSVVNIPQGNGKVYITDYDTEDKIKKIKVIITWKYKNNTTNQVDATTLIGESGLHE
jgi:type II secretory pathway pseudopilin PulG